MVFEENINVAIKNAEQQVKSGRYGSAARLYYGVAKRESKEGKYNDAVANYSLAIKYGRAISDYAIIADASSDLVALFGGLRDNKKKEDAASQAAVNYIKLAEKKSEDKLWHEVKDAYIRAIESYESIGNKEKTISTYLDLLGVLIKIDNYAEASEALNKLIKYYASIKDNVKEIKFYGMLIKIHKRIGDFKKLAEIYEAYGNRLLDFGILQEAKEAYNEAISYYKNEGNPAKVASLYEKCGNESVNEHEYEMAASDYKNAGEYYKKAGELNRASDMYIKSSKYFLDTNNFEIAASVFLEYTTLWGNENKRSKAFGYENAAECYYKTEKYENAAKNYIEYVKNSEDDTKRIYGFKKAADAYKKDGKYGSAIENYINAAELGEKNGNIGMAGVCYALVAECHEIEKDHRNMQFYYRTAVKCYRDSAEEHFKMKSYRDAAHYYMEIAAINEKLNDYEGATEYYLTYARTISLGGGLMDAGRGYEKAGEISEKIRSYKGAVESYLNAVRAYGTGRDSARCSRKIAMIYEMQDELEKADTYYSNALDMYAQIENKSEEDITKALLLKCKAKREINGGVYSDASEFLKTAEKIFSECNKSEIELEENTIDMHAEDIKRVTAKFKSGPALAIEAHYPKTMYVGIPEKIKLTLTNKKEYDLKDIEFELELPDGFKSEHIPSSLSLRGSGSAGVELEISAAETGSFSFKPIGVKYKGEGGRVITQRTKERDSIEVKEKPSLEYTVNMPEQVCEDETLTIRINVKNTSKHISVPSVVFDFEDADTDFNLEGPPKIEIEGLDPGEEKSVKYLLTPKYCGKLNFDMNVSYMDVKKKETHTIRVSEKGAFKKIIPGGTYLILEDKPKIAISIFKEEVKRCSTGLLITRTNPRMLKDEYGEKVQFYWLTNEKREFSLAPTDLTQISSVIRNFVANNEGIVLLDGIEYIITFVGFEASIKFIGVLKDMLSDTRSILLITLNSLAIKQQDINLLKRELMVIEEGK